MPMVGFGCFLTIPTTLCTDDQMMCKDIIECIDNFAPEKEGSIKNETNSWITNKIKNARIERELNKN